MANQEIKMETKKSPIINIAHMTKVFPGVKALDDVSMDLLEGEVHALMGENGAGKSTLINVLTGVIPMDSGTILYNGQKAEFHSPQQAQQAGISTVYQEVNLCLNLTVAENIFIGREPKKLGAIDWKKMNADAAELLERFDIHVDVKEQLSTYPVAIQQMVAIVRAVDISAKVLVLDEPTSSLDEKEVQQLFSVMRRLKEQGMSIVFITHFINQVYEIADRITVLRNGKFVGTFDTDKLTYMNLVSTMIGREFEEMVAEKKTEIDYSKSPNIIELRNFGKKGKIKPLDLEIKEGEVLGLAGLLGSGRTELARLIFGIDKNDSGVIYVHNEQIKRMYPQKSIKLGLAFCPEDRKEDGIFGELSIKENIVCAYQSSIGVLQKIPKSKQEELANKYVESLEIKTPSLNQKINKLSGGNQQKVILARSLATQPKMLILDEPTRGIDIGSRTEIQKMILRLAKEGMTILLISSELEEISACCDRVVVVRDREMVAMLEHTEVNESSIMKKIAQGGEN